MTVGVSDGLERIHFRSVNMKCVDKGFSNPGGPVAQATQFYAVALNICVFGMEHASSLPSSV
jgi:hypothetical protein